MTTPTTSQPQSPRTRDKLSAKPDAEPLIPTANGSGDDAPGAVSTGDAVAQRDDTTLLSENIDLKALVEQLLAWATVSYGCGFFIVLLHTARLGIPVVDLLKPIYIWVGLPLALAGFAGSRVYFWVRKIVRGHLSEFRQSLKQTGEIVRDPGGKPDAALEKLVAHTIDATAEFLPLGAFSRWALRRTLSAALAAWARDPAHARKILAEYGATLKAARVLIRLIGILLLTSLGVAMLCAYVWLLYPRIPQALGGGAARAVRVVLDAGKISPELVSLTKLSARLEKDGPPIMTREVLLLYRTVDGYWLRAGNTTFYLEKGVVLGMTVPHAGGLTLH